nr:MAG TPA: hypothetical protein [Caudoviricetes sp.]
MQEKKRIPRWDALFLLQNCLKPTKISCAIFYSVQIIKSG